MCGQRWQSRKTLSSSSLMNTWIYQNHNTLQSDYLWQWPEKIPEMTPTTKDKKKQIQWDWKEGWRHMILKIHTFWHQKWWIITVAKVLSRREGCKPHIRRSLGSCTRNRSPQTCGSGGPCGLWMGEPESYRKQRLFLKDMHKNLTHSEFQCRGMHLKKAWVQPTCWSWRDHQRGRR